MSRGSVSIDVRCGMSIDVGWVRAGDRRVVSVEGGKRVSVDERVLLSIDAVHFSLWIERSKRAGSEKSSVCSLLLLNSNLKNIRSTSVFLDYLLPDLRPQMSLVRLEKVSIDTNYGFSIDTPFSPLIDATNELSIDVSSRKLYTRV
ncbi:hypothetical protein F2Q69_00005885 [Brassica cretica]|uniref:Uncharacterized protein n=1 Tax=Brassica cretica TaxID=69181 RepID=A0A8S9PBI2_BRACR|nr:hypothetical protein F2Q69_00005885 [Brassica cretica]